MSTCNYYTHEDGAPLVVYEADDVQDVDDEFERAAMAAEEMAESLEWYRLEVRGGYYVGIQFDYIFRDDRDRAEDLTPAEARDWYDMSRSELKRKQASERRRIERWIKGWKREGWTELAHVATFSNGEAIYQRIA